MLARTLQLANLRRFTNLSTLIYCPRWFLSIAATDRNRHLSRDLSAIVIDDNLLPIIIIAQNNFDLSITDIAFVIYFAIADKLSR